MAFSRPFCLGVTWTAAEVKEGQRDGRETAKKSDGTKTRSWAGATPLFGPSDSKVTRGVAPAHRRRVQRRLFWPRRHRKRREKGIRVGPERRKQVPRGSEQPVISKRKVRLDQHAGELLDDYARFIGITAEDALNIVLRKMMANDTDFQSWNNQRRVQQQSATDPLGCPTSEAEMESP